MPSQPASDAAPEPSGSNKSCLSADSAKSVLMAGVIDFTNVFFYPLCTGIMTGVGFIVGKRIGERMFGPTAKPI